MDELVHFSLVQYTWTGRKGRDLKPGENQHSIVRDQEIAVREIAIKLGGGRVVKATR